MKSIPEQFDERLSSIYVADKNSVSGFRIVPASVFIRTALLELRGEMEGKKVGGAVTPTDIYRQHAHNAAIDDCLALLDQAIGK